MIGWKDGTAFSKSIVIKCGDPSAQMRCQLNLNLTFACEIFILIDSF